MKLSLFLPIDVDDRDEFQNTAAAVEVVKAVEAAGVDAGWVTDHPAPTTKWRHAGGHDALDPFAALAFVAAATTKLRLHTHVVVLPYRNPFLTAKGATTVDVLSNGRLILGVGVGYMRGEYAALGVDFEARGRLTDEAIETMKLAWSGESVVMDGAGFKAVGNLPKPIPVQRPHPPIWVGGNSERAIRRSVELCDGWAPFFTSEALASTTRTDQIASLDDLEAKLDVVREHLRRAERSRPFDVCAMPPVGFKACDAREAAEFVDYAERFSAMGVNWMGANLPHATKTAFLENLQWLEAEVLPRIRHLERNWP